MSAVRLVILIFVVKVFTVYCKNVSENCTCDLTSKKSPSSTTSPTTWRNGSSTTPNPVNTTVNSNVHHDLFTELLETLQKLPPIALFTTGIIVGMILSAIITCLAVKCPRCKKRSVNLADDLEMVTTEATLKVEEDEIQDQETAEGGAVESDELLVPHGDVAPKEAEYSDIDFSAMRRKNPEEQEKQDTTETEYAEIKREEMEERQNNNGEDSEMMVYSNENEVTTEELGQNQNPTQPAEDPYSNLKEIMAETSDVDVGEVTR